MSDIYFLLGMIFCIVFWSLKGDLIRTIGTGFVAIAVILTKILLELNK